MKVETKLGLTAVAGLLVALPFATGCGTGPSNVAIVPPGTNNPPPVQTAKYGTGTSRMAYAIAPDSLSQPTKVGADGATITADTATATLTTDNTDVHNQPALSRNPAGDNSAAHPLFAGRSYTGVNSEGGQAEAYVGNGIDANGDGTDDAFLSIHTNQVGNQRFEQALAYTGTRTDTAQVDALKARASHTATYTGTGRVTADYGQGGASANLDGNLTMQAQFSGANPGVQGTMAITTPVGQNNPTAVDQVTFDGAMLPASADYSIDNVKLKRQGADTVNLTQQAGVGSFFGTNAGGTVGVFQGAGQTTDQNPSDVKVQGYIQGRTTDNN